MRTRPQTARTDWSRAPSEAQRNGSSGGKQMKKIESETVQNSKGDAKPSYKPTPADLEAVEAYKVASAKRGPRLKVVATGKSSAQVDVDHPDEAMGSIALMRAIGTTDLDFFNGLLRQLVDASRQGEVSQSQANFMLSVVKGVEPRDQIETMLAAQMAAVHMASMTFARRLAHVELVPQQDSASNAFNKLTRTFASQVEALKRYRSGGEQKMTVQHVHVAEGGQAIVGNVNAPTEGVGARKKSEDQPHAQLGYAPGIEMPRQIEAERATVPRAGSSGI
jgi:hypothetical protein